MAETIACPKCGKRFKWNPALQGKRVKCTGCGEPFTMTMSTATPVAPPLPPKIPSPAAVVAASSFPKQVIPVGYESWTPDGKPLWTPKQRQCRHIGLRLMIFGGAATVLPFFGVQFVLIGWMGAWAILIGLAILFAGVVLFAGAYLSRTKAFGGPYALLKIGGLAAGSLVVLLVFLFGLTILIALVVRPKKRVATASTVPPAAVTNAPSAVTKPQPTKAAPTAKPPYTPPVALRPRPAGPPSADTQYGPQHVVHFHLEGLSALPSQDRTRLVGEAIKKLGADFQTKRFSFSSGSGDQATALLAPLDDLQAAADKVTFGTTTVDAETRTINIHIDPAKLLATQPTAPKPPVGTTPDEAMRSLEDVLHQ